MGSREISIFWTDSLNSTILVEREGKGLRDLRGEEGNGREGKVGLEFITP